jgi:hypothetical protein
MWQWNGEMGKRILRKLIKIKITVIIKKLN